MNAPLVIARRFLNYSFKDIQFKYDSLTDTEKALCTREEFKALIEWMMGLCPVEKKETK